MNGYWWHAGKKTLASVTTSSSIAEMDCANALAGSGACNVKALLIINREMGTLCFVLHNVGQQRRGSHALGLVLRRVSSPRARFRSRLLHLHMNQFSLTSTMPGHRTRAEIRGSIVSPFREPTGNTLGPPRSLVEIQLKKNDFSEIETPSPNIHAYLNNCQQEVFVLNFSQATVRGVHAKLSLAQHFGPSHDTNRCTPTAARDRSGVTRVSKGGAKPHH